MLDVVHVVPFGLTEARSAAAIRAALEAAGIAVAATPAEIGETMRRAMESKSMV